MGKSKRQKDTAQSCYGIDADHKPGTVPNMFFSAIEFDTLRLLPGFVGLPEALPPGLDEAAMPTCTRFMRQGTTDWDAAHVGVLSTGILADALGFKEDAVARSLGCAQLAGHSRLVGAVQHLKQRVENGSSTDPTRHTHALEARQFDDLHQAACQTAAKAVALANTPSQSTRIYNAATRQWMCDSVQPHRGQEDCSVRPSYMHVQPCIQIPWPVPPACPSASEVQLFKACLQIAKSGLTQIQQEWGRIQEPASLFGLMALLPKPVIHEVGLCTVPQNAIPAHWGFKPGDLPPLAASPDAMMCHPMLLPQHTHSQLVQQRNNGSGPRNGQILGDESLLLDVGGVWTKRKLMSVLRSCSRGYCCCGEAATEVSLQRSTGEVCNLCKCLPAGCETSSPAGRNRIDPECLVNAKTQTQAQLQLLLNAFVKPVSLPVSSQGTDFDSSEHPDQAIKSDNDDDEESEVQSSEPSNTCGDVNDNHQAGNSNITDSLETQQYTTGAAHNSSAVVLSNEDALLLEEVRKHIQSGALSGEILGGMIPVVEVDPTDIIVEVDPTDNSGGQSALSGNQSASNKQTATNVACIEETRSIGDLKSRNACSQCRIPAVYVECVEVKNTVPFKLCATKTGARGRTKISYIVSDRGPREHVAPYWIPQLQLHMLATGTWSALLVSRSAVKGMRVFRVWRDDEYIYRMLTIISKLYTCYVVPGRTPPANVLCREPGYQSLIDNSRRIARSAPCVMEWRGPSSCYPGADSRHML